MLIWSVLKHRILFSNADWVVNMPKWRCLVWLFLILVSLNNFNLLNFHIAQSYVHACGIRRTTNIRGKPCHKSIYIIRTHISTWSLHIHFAPDCILMMWWYKNVIKVCILNKNDEIKYVMFCKYDTQTCITFEKIDTNLIIMSMINALITME